MGQPVVHLEVDGGSVAYTVAGDGPGLLIPWCNFPWAESTFAGVLADYFRVVVAAPRGYAAGSRLAPAEQYGARLLLDDLLAVCDAVGMRRFSVFGYSLTAAVAVWLARESDRVDAVVAGGFPFLGDYSVLLEDVHERIAELDGDPGFDPRAALAFYEDLARMAPGGLLDGFAAPLLSFWGSDDEVLEAFEGRAHLEAGLRRRAVDFRVLEGTDHAMTALTIDAMLPAVVEWLSDRGSGPE